MLAVLLHGVGFARAQVPDACLIQPAPSLMRGEPTLPLLSARSKGTPVPGFQINPGLTGSWFEPATSGQGFLLDVVDTPQVISFAWFTYGLLDAGTAPPQRWLVGVGEYVGDSASTELFLSEGGRLGAPPDPGSTPVGSATWVFSSCTQATVTYSVLRSALGDAEADPAATVTGEIALQRLTPDQHCQMFASLPKSGFALVGAKLLPMDSDRVLDDHTLVVRNGAIAAIGPRGSTPIDDDLVQIDARGRWVMPGLIDFHTHEAPGVQAWPDDTAGNLVMNLANGVTSIVNMGEFTGVLPAFQRAVREGTLPGPELYLGHFARHTSEGGASWNTLDSEADARVIAQRARSQGYDFVKSYSALTRGQFDALVAEARVQGLSVLGHSLNTVANDDQIRAGLGMLVHASSLLRASADGGVQSTADLDALAALMVQENAYLGGTLAVMEIILGWGNDGLAGADPWPRVASQRGIEYMDDRSVDAWRLMLDFRSDLTRPFNWAPSFAWLKQVVAGLHARGVKVIPGSDSIGVPGIVPGFAMHRELEIFAEAGIGRFDVLASATRDAGQLIADKLRSTEQVGTRVGTLELGSRADLLLLDADPRVSFATLRSPLGVMAAGRWYPKAWLDAEMQSLRDDR